MKSAIGGALMVIGLLVLVGSVFVGKEVAADEEWTDEKQEEFSQLTVDIHVPSRSSQVNEQKIERLKEMQQQLINAKTSRDSRRRMMKIAGFTTVLLGLGFQFWAWADQKKE